MQLWECNSMHPMDSRSGQSIWRPRSGGLAVRMSAEMVLRSFRRAAGNLEPAAKNARWAWRPPRYAHPPPANRPRCSVWSLLGGGRQGTSRAAADWLEIEMAGALPLKFKLSGRARRRPPIAAPRQAI